MSWAQFRKDLHTEEIQVCAIFWTENTVDGKLREGAIKGAANKFKVCRRTVERVCLELHHVLIIYVPLIA